VAVFVLDKRGKPLMPCSEKRARVLLERGRARVHRIAPFTIRLVDRTVEGSDLQPLCIKLDPGSRTTGIALVRESDREAHVVFLAEMAHRGQVIRDALQQRAAFRRRRRSNLRYRAPRFNNRPRPEGWLAPSLQHRVDGVMAWVKRLQRWAPVTAISQELARFDPQKLQNPEISGIEYQQGEFAGYEVREYLLEKWGRECAYCGAKYVPLTIDHIYPKSKGGSDRVSNLTLACFPCNQKKGNRDVAEFLARDPKRLARVQVQARAPLADAAVVNGTRWALWNRLKGTGLPVEACTGARTKGNRSRLGIPKTHALDAACVGGAYQRTRLSKHGSPRGFLTCQKRHFGFQTGDLVRAEVPTGKKAGIYVGRVVVRTSGSFNVQTPQGIVEGVSHRYCRMAQRGDGYGYSWRAAPGRKQGTAQVRLAVQAAPSLCGMNAGASGANW